MAINRKGFRIFVAVLVILTGAGFGTLTGFAYSENPLWITVATIAGVVSSFLLAKYYLFRLGKIATKCSRFRTWLLGTVIGILSGIVCTTIVHGIMTCQLAIEEKTFPLHLMDGFWLLTVLISEAVGAVAGFVVGGICSWIYVSFIAGKSNGR